MPQSLIPIPKVGNCVFLNCCYIKNTWKYDLERPSSCSIVSPEVYIKSIPNESSESMVDQVRNLINSTHENA